MLDRTMKKRKPRHPTGPGSRRPDARRPSAEGGSDAWVYGEHATLAVLANPRRRISRVVATPQAAESHVRTLAGHPLDVLTRAEIDALLPNGAVHQGIAAMAAPLQPSAIEDVLASLEGQDTAVMVILDQATDPRNVGAVLRSAAAFGAGCVIVQDRHAPPATGSLAKAASGALETVPLVRVGNLSRAMKAAQDAGFWCLGLDDGGQTTIADADTSGRVAMVFGAEGAGLRRLTRETCDLLVRIPTAPAMASLNLSNAVAVALYAVAAGRP
ncbi:MAG: 23S rRNA (guanosine(2251)-2'-O)-methyltransferase RlmB [Rhodospirillaceae bacterium]